MSIASLLRIDSISRWPLNATCSPHPSKALRYRYKRRRPSNSLALSAQCGRRWAEVSVLIHSDLSGFIVSGLAFDDRERVRTVGERRLAK